MARPSNDVITAPDVDEVLHHVRESQQRWQQTATTLARQRDLYANEVTLLEAENYALRLAAQRLRDAVMDERHIVVWGDRHPDPSVAEAVNQLDVLLDPPDPEREEQPNPEIAQPGWVTSSADRVPDGTSRASGEVPV